MFYFIFVSSYGFNFLFMVALLNYNWLINRRIYLVLLLFSLTSISTYAATLFSISNGDWHTAGTWSYSDGGASCSCVPGSTDEVNLGHNVGVFGAMVNNGIINITPSGRLSIVGSFMNNGTINIAGGTLDISSASTNHTGAINGFGNIMCGGSFASSGTVNGSPVGSCEDTQILLPVELTYFEVTAIDGSLHVVWETATETNNDYFTIETSKEGELWVELMRVKGAGNSTSSKEYVQQGITPLWPTAYYRLKQTDYDGAYAYSDMIRIVINTNETGAPVRVYPNLLGSNTPARLKFDRSLGSDTKLSIYSVEGKLILTRDLNESNNFIELPGLPVGTYLLKIVDATGFLTTKIQVK